MDPATRWRLENTEYPAVRRVLGPARYQLDDEAVEALLADAFPGAEPEDVEDFMQTMQGFGRQAAPVAQKALPGVIQGAVAGSAGGPMGMVAGGLIGGAGSAFSGSRAPSRAAAPAVPGPPASPVAAPGIPGTPTPAALLAGAAAAPAATAQLLALLSRPETMQALLALLMAGSGRSTVQVGAEEVPAAAFANAISETAARIAETATLPLEESASEYLFDNGDPRGDLANPVERAVILVADLFALAAQEAAEEEDESDTLDGMAEGEDEQEQDPLAEYESALLGALGYEY